MTQIEKIQENVDKITLGDKTIYLVGTAHLSQSSTDLAENIIREYKPDAVAVELCESRLQSLKDPNRWRNTDIVSVIRAGKAYVLLAQLMLAAFQRKLGGHLKVKPGAEMMRAVQVAEELGLRVVLADRDVKVTLKRTWASLSLWSGFNVASAMLSGILGGEKLSIEEVEKLKSSDALEGMLEEFSKKLPGVRESLIDERDRYLSQKIKNAPGSTVVAIIGAGHIPGIKTYLEQDIDLTPLEQIPPKKLSLKLITWGIPVLFLTILAYGCMHAGTATSLNMLWIWFIAHGVLAGLGAIAALAHPITVVVTFFAASFNPLVRVGLVAAVVEALLRKPRVSDLELIADDLLTVRGIWTNRVSKIFLVLLFTSLGAVLGTVVGLERMASLL